MRSRIEHKIAIACAALAGILYLLSWGSAAVGLAILAFVTEIAAWWAMALSLQSKRIERERGLGSEE